MLTTGYYKRKFARPARDDACSRGLGSARTWVSVRLAFASCTCVKNQRMYRVRRLLLSMQVTKMRLSLPISQIISFLGTNLPEHAYQWKSVLITLGRKDIQRMPYALRLAHLLISHLLCLC